MATCPKGKQLTGMGFSVLNGNGQVIVDDLIPDGGAGTAPTSVYVRAYEKGLLAGRDYAGRWRVTAYAVCANPLPGLVRMSRSTGSTSLTKSVTVPCPAGKALLGAGFELHASLGRVTVSTLVPFVDSLGIHDVLVGAGEVDPLRPIGASTVTPSARTPSGRRRPGDPVRPVSSIAVWPPVRAPAVPAARAA